MTLQRRQDAPIACTGEIVALSEYRDKGMNVLYPTPMIARVSPFHQVRVETVQLSTVDADRDTYKSRSFCKDNERALAKNGLMKLARAAGIQWDPDRCRRVDDMKDPSYVCYEAVGGIRLPDATWQWMKAMKEIDLREGGSEESKLRKHALYKVEKGEDEWVDGRRTGRKRRWSVEEADEYVRKELAAAKEHKLSNAETKAMLRVARSLLQIKPAYTMVELSKPFAVPHLDFAPDYTDPQVRQMMLCAGAAAQGALYGGQPVMPSADVRQMQGPSFRQSMPALEAVTDQKVTIVQVDAEYDDEGNECCGGAVEESHADLLGDPKATPLGASLQAMRDVETLEELRAIAAELGKGRERGQYTDEQWQRVRAEYDEARKRMGVAQA